MPVYTHTKRRLKAHTPAAWAFLCLRWAGVGVGDSRELLLTGFSSLASNLGKDTGGGVVEDLREAPGLLPAGELGVRKVDPKEENGLKRETSDHYHFSV